MVMELSYGRKKQRIEVDDDMLLQVIVPNEVECDNNAEGAIKYALENPIDSKRLSEMVKPCEKIVIITSDITRPVPSRIIMPYIIGELKQAGVSNDNICIVFALGSHRKHTEEEIRYLVGNEIFDNIECVDSNIKKCVHMGITKRGTPVDIFEKVANADRKICIGNVEYHYFAGYSGGAKAIMPGVSTREAIQCNHSAMVDEGAYAGRLVGNPVREDIEEAGAIVNIDFILNVVLNEKKEIIKAEAGNCIKAHRKACEFLDMLYKVNIKKRADIVIVSPGGYPKDINLYQAQKALDNSKHAVRDGGIIILAASCVEGLGEKVFEKWMTESPSPEFMINEIKHNFQLGGHKAAAIALVLSKSKIFLVSDMDSDFVEGLFMKPYKNIQDAYDAAVNELGKESNVIIMPYGGSTLPIENIH